MEIHPKIREIQYAQEENISVEEEVIPMGFFLLKCSGFWQPTAWKDKRYIIAYKIYTSLNLMLMGTAIFAEITNIILYSDSFDQAVNDDISIKLSRFNETFKLSWLLSKRDRIIGLLKHCLDKRWHTGRNDEEVALIEQFKWMRKWSSSGFIFTVALSFMSGVIRTFIPTNEHEQNKSLAIWESWYPYNMSNPRNYWISFAQFTLSCCGIVLGHVATACLISGFMWHICTQIELLKYRILQVPRIIDRAKKKGVSDVELEEIEKSLVVDRIYEHRSILSFVKNMNETFDEVQFVQFFTLMIMLCTSIYQMSRSNVMTINFFTIVCFAAADVGLIFIFCWCGSQISIRSSDITNVIFEASESGIRVSSQKNLLLMMICGRKPLQMYAGSIITWNLDSFISVLKTSYSAFNVLQRTVS